MYLTACRDSTFQVLFIYLIIPLWHFMAHGAPNERDNHHVSLIAPAVDSGFKCNFDKPKDQCPLQNTPDSTVDCRWAIRKGRGSSLNSGPPSDHTLQNADGSYLYFDATKCRTSNEPRPERVSLITQQRIHASLSTAQCLTFWYHMYGSTNRLTVSVTSSDASQEQIKFARKGNQRDRWLKADVSITNLPKTPYRISFKTSPGQFGLGDVSLDDISFQDGPCTSSKSICDFESEDMCGFQTVSDGDPAFIWGLVKSGESVGPETKFMYDHTFDSPEGHVTFANGDSLKPGIRTSLTSPKQPPGDEWHQCITFWYQIDTGELLVTVQSASSARNEETATWSASGELRKSWEFGTVPVTTTDEYDFTFIAVNGVNSHFALDDIALVAGQCPNALNCDFEDGLCGWSSDDSSAVGWLLHEGLPEGRPTPGPDNDHTTNSRAGHYVFMSGSDQHPPNLTDTRTAALTSQRTQIIPNGDPNWCFIFWYYYRSGDSPSHDASLRLDLIRSGQTDANLFNRKLSPTNKWIKGMAGANAIQQQFVLVFQGTLDGKSQQSTIAVDDFLGENRSCKEESDFFHQCPNGNKIPLEKVCNQVNDCEDKTDEKHCGQCQFAVSAESCGYTATSTDGFAFTFMTNGTTSLPGFSGPGDNQSPSYMFASFEHGSVLSSTYLEGKSLHETSATCKVKFSYILQSDSKDDAGRLLLTLKRLESETTLAIIDRAVVPFNSPPWKWSTRTVDIGRMSGEFKLLFRAEKPGVPASGYIALDEVEMITCDFPPALSETCLDHEFRCDREAARSVCISRDKVCDFTDDCGSGQDERNCHVSHPYRCDFQRDLCDWSHGDPDVYRWLQTNDKELISHTGPLRDHTTGLKGSGFAYLPSSSEPAIQGRNFTLFNRLLFAPTTHEDRCRIRFYTHMYGRSLGRMWISRVSEDGEETEIDWYRYSIGDTWSPKVVSLVSAKPFTVLFRGIVGGPSSDMAIDDISFTENCRLHGSTSPATLSTVPTTHPTTTTSKATETPPGSPTTQPDMITLIPTSRFSPTPTISPDISSVTFTQSAKTTTKAIPLTNPATVKPSTPMPGKQETFSGWLIAGIVCGILLIFAAGLVVFFKLRPSAWTDCRILATAGSSGQLKYSKFDQSDA